MSTDGSHLPRHGQQRDGAGPRASADRRHRGQAAAQAQHELAVQLRGGGRVQRAARRDAARPAGHGLPGQLRLGGKRSGDPARDGGDGPARRGRGPRGLSRLDVRHRRGVHVDRRQPERARHPAGLGAHRGIAQQLPRQVPRRRRRAVRRARRCGRSSELVADGRAPAAFICESVYGNAGGMALPDGYLQQVYAAVRGGRRAGDLRRGAGRVRPSRRMVLGFHAAGRGARHRRRSRSRRATAIRSAR